MTHETLLKKFAKGDQKAAIALTQALTPLCYQLALRLTQNHHMAEDIAQDSMLALWRQAPKWEPKAKVTTWLYTVTRNRCYDVLKRTHPSGEMDDIAYSPQPGLALDLQKALSSLPDTQRDAVIFKHLEGLSQQEIATIMNTTTQAVESLLKRGRATLRTILEDTTNTSS